MIEGKSLDSSTINHVFHFKPWPVQRCNTFFVARVGYSLFSVFLFDSQWQTHKRSAQICEDPRPVYESLSEIVHVQGEEAAP